MAEGQDKYQIEENVTKLKSEFKDLKQLEKGGFGVVEKATEISTGKVYAIKTVRIQDLDKNKEEVNLIRKLKSVYVVEFVSAWKNKKYLFIQMELYQGNLKKIIEEKPRAFNRESDEGMGWFEFYLSCELLKELTECLNFLHKSCNCSTKCTCTTPPIMHRDLKPQNVLITKGEHGRFLRLGDFGLSKEYLRLTNTNKTGTLQYMAWEVKETEHYNIKADIFSLAVIALELFGFKYDYKDKEIDLKKLLMPYIGTELETKFRNILKVLEPCTSHSTHYEERPSCKEFLEKIHDWQINQDLIEDRNIRAQDGNEFFRKYAQAKLN